MSVIGRSAAISFTAVVVAAGFFHARAAEVPDALNYQGVLRDASDAPADGPHEMVFRFWTAPEGGEELLRDRHEAAGSGAVIVTRGLFSVELGEGVVEDGAGDGDYTSLADVFRAHRDVWLEVQIGDETLAPRTPVAAAAYAFNAAHLGGRRADEFLDGCDANQFKLGRLVVGAASGTTLDFGVEGYGSNGGGHFEDTNGSGFAQVGYGNFGIRAEGNFAGGYFKDLDGSAFGYAGYNNFGFRGVGSTAGGYFSDLETDSFAYVGYGRYGAYAVGLTGAYFASTGSGYSFIGHENHGVMAYGDSGGGYFRDLDSQAEATVAKNTYKILGTGAVSFVQNYPESKERVIVYHAPESSEVSVYTRGRARLEKGRAVVELDETFAWVTNPDLGLTAHLTPRGASCTLHVEDVSSEVLTVATDDPACDTIELDYMVWGLRIGFEDLTPVQPKTRDAPIPSMTRHRTLGAQDASLRGFTARKRFEAIESELRGVDAASLDTSRARALLARIGEAGAGDDGSAEAPRPAADRTAERPHEADTLAPAVERGGDVAESRLAVASGRAGGGAT